MAYVLDKLLNFLVFLAIAAVLISVKPTEKLIKEFNTIARNVYQKVDTHYPNNKPLDERYKPQDRTFGFRFHPIYKRIKFHNGIDIAAPSGTPIRPVANGYVVKMEYKAGGYGTHVVLKHDKTVTSLYAHCSRILVNVGEYVTTEDTLALVGSTGTSTSPHLHLCIFEDNVAVNPLNYIRYD